MLSRRAVCQRQLGFLIAVGDEGKKRKWNGRHTKSHDVIFELFVGADTPGSIRMKFGERISPHDLIETSDFCNKIFRGSSSTGSRNLFPIDTASHLYNTTVYSAALPPVIQQTGD